MQAVVYPEFTQDYSNIKIQRVPKPVPAAGQVLVKVNVAAINPVDAFVSLYLLLLSILTLVTGSPRLA